MRNYIRRMRKYRPIDALFPQVRRDLLAAFFLQPDRWWYLSELAEHLGTRPSSLQRELASLTSSGVLRQKRDGKRVYFQPESEAPIFKVLAELMTLTQGLPHDLAAVMDQFGDRVLCAFIFGSTARNEDNALSDVDLMVIGSVGLADLATSIHRLEQRFRRQIDISCYSPDEFKKKVSEGNHLLTRVLEQPKIFLKGTEHELETIVGRSNSATARHQSARDRQPSRSGRT